LKNGQNNPPKKRHLKKGKKNPTGGRTSMEQLCLDTGGQPSTASCCIGANDYPNLCLIGACGCSPDNSEITKVCDCLGSCFNSEIGCVA